MCEYAGCRISIAAESRVRLWTGPDSGRPNSLTEQREQFFSLTSQRWFAAYEHSNGVSALEKKRRPEIKLTISPVNFLRVQHGAVACESSFALVHQ